MLEKEIILFKSVSDIEKANFFDYLSVMIDGWVTISSALESVITRVKNPFFRNKIKELQTFILSWDSISKSMKKIPDIFDDSETSIIEAWEKSWTLVTSLSNIAIDLKKSDELKSKVKSALTYPIIILLFLLISVIVVMIYVIPSIQPLFETAEVELPFATQALIVTSDFFSNNLWLILFLIIAFSLFIAGYKNTDSWKVFFDRLLLKLPLIGDVYRNYILSRVIINLWTLINWWVPIIKTLSLVWKSSNNVLYEEIFERVIAHVSEWKKIVESILEVDKYNEFFTPDYLQMLSVWEKTASIWKVSKKIHEQYTKEVSISLENLTKWVEPMAIFLAWIFVLWFAFAIFWAILKVTQTIG